MATRTLRLQSGQEGFSLPVALVFVLVLSFLGLAVIAASVMQETMTGNSKDSNLAFQAAETTLRDGEADVALNIGPGSSFSQTCTNGLCTPPSTWSTPQSAPIYLATSSPIDWQDRVNVRAYGAYTGAAALPGLAAPPVYVIEKLAAVPISIGESVGIGMAPRTQGTAYRITAYSTGARPETHAVLESIYVKR